LDKHPIIFSGNGAAKWEKICRHPNASFRPLIKVEVAMAHLTYIAFLNNQLADLAYTEPFYLKEFQNNI
jgi:tRNA threonylcarbamoyladenosine biosynthesis protein TsaB